MATHNLTILHRLLLTWMVLFLVWPVRDFGGINNTTPPQSSRLSIQQLSETTISNVSCIGEIRTHKSAGVKIQSPLAFKKHRTVYQSLTEKLKAARAVSFVQNNHLTFNIPKICLKFPLSEHTQEG
ncbi:MAG TPA: hypothetical protein VGA99_08295 [bacterium]|jgi:hypothetical protein